MLMADFVKQTTHGIDKLSKGVRIVHCSRDVFYDEDTNVAFFIGHDLGEAAGGLRIEANGSISSGTMFAQLPYFGTDAVWRGRQVSARAETITEFINSTALGTRTNVGTGNDSGGAITHANSPILGVNGIKGADTSGSFHFTQFEIASMVHSSSHYQSFEHPFLTELVGGDRNMEQNNLVVTTDGKTWDEITRDTSYLSKEVLSTMNITGNSSGGLTIFTEWRGAKTNRTGWNYYKTDYVVWAYDRAIILKDGQYKITREGRLVDSYPQTKVFLNGEPQINYVTGVYNTRGAWEHHHSSVVLNLKRGDFLKVTGYSGGTSTPGEGFYIERVE